MPGFIKNIDKVRAKGYESVVCVSVNDPFVTAAWAKEREAEGKVRILADPKYLNLKILKIFYLQYSNLNFNLKVPNSRKVLRWTRYNIFNAKFF